MKIAYLVANIRPCGPVSVVEQLIDYEVSKKNQVLLIALFGVRNDAELVRRLSAKATILTIGYRGVLSRFLLFGRRQILQIIHENGIKIIHSHGIIADYATPKNDSIKKVTTLHCNLKEDYSLSFGKMKGLFYAKWHGHILGKFDTIVACSESVYRSIPKRLKKKRAVKYIRNGINIKERPNRHEQEIRRAIRQELGIPQKDIVLICAARVIGRRKRVVELSQKFAEKAPSNFKLLIAGDGGERERCAKSKNIIMLGRVNNLTDYMMASDIYVSNSLSEGLSMAALEALASNNTLLLSDIASHRELVYIDDTYCGSIFKNLDDFIGQLKTLRIAKAYSENFLHLLSSRRMGEEYDLLYQELLK